MSPPGGAAAKARLQIHLQPRAARTRLVGRHGGASGDAWKVQVHAPPQDGKANAALIDLLSELLGVPRRSIRIVAGATARKKVVEIEGAGAAECHRRLESNLLRSTDREGDAQSD